MSETISIPKKSKSDRQIDSIVVFILLLCSGNNLLRFIGPGYPAIGLFLVLILTRFSVLKDRTFLNFVTKIFIFLGLLLFLQEFNLGFVSWIGGLNFFFKILLGGTVAFYLKDDFSKVLFNTLFYLCVISLVGFLIVNILNAQLPKIELSEGRFSYLIYSTSDLHFHQNQGMFWEPGAFAGILTLTLALHIEQIKKHFRKYKSRVAIILITLITTQSTTGYISAFLLATIFIMSQMKPAAALLALAIFSIVSITVYNSFDFLSTKISEQYERSKTLDEGEFSNSRFGSLIFDWYYIQKHPIIGNGLHEKTRYADHPDLIQIVSEGDNLGNGNGFSNFVASMGIVAMLLYLSLIYRSAKRVSLSYAIGLLTVIMINLQGEPWLDYALYLGLPFLRLEPFLKPQVSTRDLRYYPGV